MPRRARSRIRRARPSGRHVGLPVAPLPAAAGHAPPPETGGTPPPPVASGPDYGALIHSSPAYQAWLASANARRANLATGRAGAIRQLALQYGGLPAGYKDAYGDLRPEDIAAEQGNQFSIQKGIERNYKQGVENMHRGLAARGMLESGDLGYGQQQADLVHGQAEHDAAAQFLASLNEAISGYTGGMGDIGSEESGVIAQVLPLIEQLYPSGGGGGAGGGATAGGGGAGGAVAPATASGAQSVLGQLRRQLAHRPAHARRTFHPRRP